MVVVQYNHFDGQISQPKIRIAIAKTFRRSRLRSLWKQFIENKSASSAYCSVFIAYIIRIIAPAILIRFTDLFGSLDYLAILLQIITVQCFL